MDRLLTRAARAVCLPVRRAGRRCCTSIGGPRWSSRDQCGGHPAGGVLHRLPYQPRGPDQERGMGSADVRISEGHDSCIDYPATHRDECVAPGLSHGWSHANVCAAQYPCTS